MRPTSTGAFVYSVENNAVKLGPFGREDAPRVPTFVLFDPHPVDRSRSRLSVLLYWTVRDGTYVRVPYGH
jgi:hypothetical protein